MGANSHWGAAKWSYKKGCQEKTLPPSLREDVDVVACIQPRLRPGRVGAALASSVARPTQLMFVTGGFHDAMVLDAFSSGSYTSQKDWLKCQP
jgi:hypothetical protein